MRILMLSWEYPPKSVGGLSTHVYHLSHALSKAQNEVHVITCEEGTAPVEENDDGVIVHRVEPYKIETEDFTKWVMQLNFSMIEEASRLILKTGSFDIIHAHDWLSAYCARVLKWAFKIPMVCTMHATEYGRNNGIKTDMQRYISSTEWMLTYESWKIVTCSNYMRQQVKDIFAVPWEKIWVIPNGVETHDMNFKFDWLEFRRKYAKDNEKIVLYVGRHVFEKGVHLLIEAASQIVNGYNDIKFIIAGEGPMTQQLKDRVKSMGLQNKFEFIGYMDEDTKRKLYRVSNVAVFPSLYEPFGIVALEAMSAKCPVVVSDTGGLGEIIKHKFNGMKTIVGLPQSIADNILQVLKDDSLANTIKENAYKTVVEKYTWDKIAKLTIQMYNVVLKEALGTDWGEKYEIAITKKNSPTSNETSTEVSKVPQKTVTLEKNISVSKKTSTESEKVSQKTVEQSVPISKETSTVDEKAPITENISNANEKSTQEKIPVEEKIISVTPEKKEKNTTKTKTSKKATAKPRKKSRRLSKKTKNSSSNS